MKARIRIIICAVTVMVLAISMISFSLADMHQGSEEKEVFKDERVDSEFLLEAAEAFSNEFWNRLSTEERNDEILNAKNIYVENNIDASDEMIEKLAVFNSDRIRFWGRPVSILLNTVPDNWTYISVDETEAMTRNIMQSGSPEQWISEIYDALVEKTGGWDFAVGSGMVSYFFAVDRSMTKFVVYTRTDVSYIEIDENEEKVINGHIIANFFPDSFDDDAIYSSRIRCIEAFLFWE